MHPSPRTHEFSENPSACTHQFSFVHPSSRAHQISENPSDSTHQFSENPSACSHQFSEDLSACTHRFSENPSACTHRFSENPSACTHRFSENPSACPHQFSENPSTCTHQFSENPQLVRISFLCASISWYTCVHCLRLDEVHNTFSDQRLVSITKPQEGFLCEMCLNSVFTQTTYTQDRFRHVHMEIIPLRLTANFQPDLSLSVFLERFSVCSSGTSCIIILFQFGVPEPLGTHVDRGSAVNHHQTFMGSWVPVPGCFLFFYFIHSATTLAQVYDIDFVFNRVNVLLVRLGIWIFDLHLVYHLFVVCS